ncbi:WG repeat-containing protein, partial [Campylobacter coli]
KVKLNGKYGFIDKSGKIIAKPKFDYGGYFSEGLASVGLNGKYGFIDKSGEFVIEPIFDDIYY